MFKKNKQREKVETLYKLKLTIKQESEKYLSETRKEFDEIEKQIDKKIKKILDEKQNEEIGTIEKLIEETNEKIKKNKEEMQKEKEELKKRVENMLQKLIDIRFHPPEYVFELNMIRGLTVDLEENIEKNPLIRVEFEERTSKLEYDIERYLRLHEEVLKFVEKETTDIEVIKLKEELTRDLQMGRLDEIEEKLKK